MKIHKKSGIQLSNHDVLMSLFGRVLIAVVFFAWNGAYGAAWELHSDSLLVFEYDDNKRLTSDQHEEVLGISLTPGFSLTGTGPLVRTALKGYWTFTKYPMGNVDPEDKQMLVLDSQWDGQTNKLRMAGQLIEDTTLVVHSVDDDAFGDEQLDPEEGLTSVQINRRRYKLSPSWQYLFSNRFSVRFAYDGRGTQYSSDLDSGLIDFIHHKYLTSAIWNVDKLEQLGVTAGVQIFDPAEGSGTKSQSLDMFYSWRLTQISAFKLAAGYFKSEVDSAAEDIDYAGGTLSLTYASGTEVQKNTYTLSRGLNPSSGGQMIISDRLAVNLRHNISQRVSAIGSLSYLRNSVPEREVLKDNRMYYIGQAGISWALSRTLGLDVTYRYRNQKYDYSGDQADSNALFLTLRHRVPHQKM